MDIQLKILQVLQRSGSSTIFFGAVDKDGKPDKSQPTIIMQLPESMPVKSVGLEFGTIKRVTITDPVTDPGL